VRRLRMGMGGRLRVRKLRVRGTKQALMVSFLTPSLSRGEP
jgi:hypothetical protein